MDAHQHLYRPSANTNLSNPSKGSEGSSAVKSSSSNNNNSSNRSNSRPRPGLLTKIHRLISPAGSVFGGLKGSSLPAPSLPVVLPFRIVHERDETPAYVPASPVQPRTSDECKEALEEMFARARGEGSPWEETAKSKAEQQQERQQQERQQQQPPPRSNQSRPPTSPPPIPPLLPPRPSFSPARDGVIQSTRSAAAAPRPLQLPQGLKTAGARLETIPASPLITSSDAMKCSTTSSPPTSATPTTHARERAIAAPDSPMTPSTPRLAADSRGIQRVIAGAGGELVLRAPRPLSERAMIPLDLRARRARLRQGEHAAQRPLSPLSPLRPGPLSASSSSSSPSSPTRQEGRLQISQSPLRLSPLRPSPMEAVASQSRQAFTGTVVEKNTMEPPPKTPPSRSQSDAEADAEADTTQRTPRQQMRLNSMRAHDGEDADSCDDLIIGPEAPSPRTILGLQSRLDGEDLGSASRVGAPSRRPPPPPPPPRMLCYMCPEPCRPGTGLCGTCQRRFQRPADSGLDPSESDDEDAPSLSLSLSPRKTKPLSTTPSTPMRGAHHHQQHHRSSNTAASSSPETPMTPRGWSRISTPVSHQRQQIKEQYSSSGKSSLSSSQASLLAKQLKALPSPPPLRKISIASSTTLGRKNDEYEEAGDDHDQHHDDETGSFVSDRRGSALYHLERSMKLENWQPLATGGEPWPPGHDVIRVGNVPSPRVVVRNSNAENADTMKMLANEGLEDVNASRPRPGHERRHEAGRSYGDWFSFYGEGEEDDETWYVDDNTPSSSCLLSSSPVSTSLNRHLFRGFSNRESTGSSIYDRIQSIYDTYAELSEGEEDEEEVEMF